MPDQSVLNLLNWNEIAGHFRDRVAVSKELLSLHDAGKTEAFAKLAVGITGDGVGNYSAAEHPILKLGISENNRWEERIFRLATEFRALSEASQVPILIANARIKYLQISVGSEMSCMVNPDVCWVCNVRTIWLHLAWKRGPGDAEELLKLFREGAADSEMAYVRWADEYHPKLQRTLIDVATEGLNRANPQGTMPDGKLFLWADAIASHAYGRYHGE